MSEWSGVGAQVDDWQTPGLRKNQASTVREHLSRITYFSHRFMDPPSQMPQVTQGVNAAEALRSSRNQHVNVDRGVPQLAGFWRELPLTCTGQPPYCVSLRPFLRAVQRESEFSGVIRTLIRSGQGPTLRTWISSSHFLRSPSPDTHRGLGLI